MRAQIGALIEPELIVEAEDDAVLVDRGTHAVNRAPRLVRRDEMLIAVLDPLDRPAEAQCRGADEDVFRVKLAADAEAAAHVPFMQMDAPGRQTEHRLKRQ